MADVKTEEVNEADLRSAGKPLISLEAAISLAADLFGIAVTPDNTKELESYDDKNFLLKDATLGEYTGSFVLKIHNSVESANAVVLGAQDAALGHLKSKGFQVPNPVELSNGKLANAVAILPSRCDSSANLDYVVRLLHFVEGKEMHKSAVTPALLVKLGRFAGSLSGSLSDFSHPGTLRDYIWDLRNFLDLEPKLDSIIDESQRALAGEVFAMFKQTVVPVFESGTLRSAVIHGDLNANNVLLSQDEIEVTGVIDFGDMITSFQVCEVAIAMAYAMLDQEDPIQAAASVLSGYHAVFPLTPEEVRLLPMLVAARIALSVTMSAANFSKDPSNEYLLITAKPGWQALRTFWAADAALITETFEGATTAMANSTSNN